MSIFHLKKNSTPFSEDIVFNCQIHFLHQRKMLSFFCAWQKISPMLKLLESLFFPSRNYFFPFTKILSPIIYIHPLAQNLCKSSIFSVRLPDGPIASTDTSTGGGVLLFRMMTMMVMMMIRSMIKIIITTTMMIVCSSSSMDEIKKNEHFEQL